MTQSVHLFLEEEQVEELEAAQQEDLPPAVAALIAYILMWKEQA